MDDFKISLVINFVFLFLAISFSPFTVPYIQIDRCSAIGPKANAGKKVKAAKIYTINTRIIIKVTLSVRSVPTVSLTFFLANIDQAIASCAIIAIYLPKNIARPAVIFQNAVLSAKPSNPEPLFAAEEANSYST